MTSQNSEVLIMTKKLLAIHWLNIWKKEKDTCHCILGFLHSLASLPGWGQRDGRDSIAVNVSALKRASLPWQLFTQSQSLWTGWGGARGSTWHIYFLPGIWKARALSSALGTGAIPQADGHCLVCLLTAVRSLLSSLRCKAAMLLCWDSTLLTFCGAISSVSHLSSHTGPEVYSIDFVDRWFHR